MEEGGELRGGDLARQGATGHLEEPGVLYRLGLQRQPSVTEHGVTAQLKTGQLGPADAQVCRAWWSVVLRVRHRH